MKHIAVILGIWLVLGLAACGPTTASPKTEALPQPMAQQLEVKEYWQH